MTRIKSVGVMSFAKIAGLGYFALGLLLAPLYLFIGLMASIAGRQAGSPQFPAALFVVLAILSPFLYGGMGFITGAIGALVYNLLAGWVGGIEMEFEAVPPVYPVIPASPISGQPLQP